ncbi:MAG TPA: hypothetical protein VFW30_01465 [Bryocella sp.]|nr:hypothetical protein [Bryocella sp.]
MKRTLISISGMILCSFLALTLGAQERSRATSPAQEGQNSHAMGSSPCAWWATPAVGNPLVQKKDVNSDTDIGAIVNGLRSSGFTCGVFVIESTGSRNSYSTFQKLLDATKDTNIKLWVVIIPPSEGADSLPYRSDYVAWSRALAKLSLKYKNFRGFNIDDIDQDISLKTFTRDYVCKIYRAKMAINPRLLFVPTVYDLDRSVADRLAGCVDGAWLWWVNLEKSTGLPSFLENSRLATEGRFPIYGGVYAHWTSWHGVKEGNPKPDVFQEFLEDSCKYSDGAIIWQLSLAPDDPLLTVTKTFLPGGSSPYAGKCGMNASSAKR